MRVASNIVVPDVVIPSPALTWLVRLVNEYAQPAREAAGEESDPSRRDGRPRRHAHLADDATRPYGGSDWASAPATIAWMGISMKQGAVRAAIAR
jgi:hypothetical protein